MRGEPAQRRAAAILLLACGAAATGCAPDARAFEPASATATVTASEAGTATPPSIVMIMADDLGWGDVGFNGGEIIRTPHLDALAAAGMRFDRFYAQAPVCSPTRGSCLTGRHPFRYGVFGANVGHLPADEDTLAELLAQRGYATGHFGKWHLGTMTADYSGKRNRRPEANHMTPGMAGFDRWFSTEYAVATWDPYDPANRHGRFDVRNLYWHDGKNVADGPARGLVGDDSRIIVDRALPFVRDAVAAGRPFFVVIWFHAPHAPVVGGPAYRAAYDGRPEDEQHYDACVTAMDEQVGRLRAELDALGVAGETLITFCSDNGPEGNPEATGRSRGSAGPFRGRKRSLYEGGVRVPGVVVWPGQIEPGSTTSFPASTSDYVPTILEVVGMDPPPRPLDGVSLAAVLAGAPITREPPIFFQTRQQRAVSGPRFKLVQNLRETRPAHDNGATPFAAWELYDVIADPGETTNLIDAHPGVVSEMRAALAGFVASCDASRDRRR